MKNIKYITVIVVITLLMSACSDYPTSGRISFEALEEKTKQEFVVNRIETEGYLFEFEEDIFERIEKFENQFYNLKQVIRKPYTADSFKDFYSSDVEVINAIDAFFSQRKEFANQVNTLIEQGKQQRLDNFQKQKKIVDNLQLKQDSIKQYTQGPQDKLDLINSNIKKSQDETNKIIDNIVNKTNEVIIAEKLPIKKLSGRYLNLSSQELTVSVNAANCENTSSDHYNRYKNYNSKRFIVIDERKSHGRCVYINPPHKDVRTPNYDEYIVNEFIKTRNWDEKTLKKELNIAKKELKDAKVIAENQLNIKIYHLNREFDNEKRKLKNLNKANQEIDLEEMIQSLGFSSLIEGEKRSDKYGFLSSNSDIINEGRKIKPSSSDIENNYTKAIYKYRLNALEEIFEDATKEITEIDSNGTFSGLDGSFGYLVPIILMDIEIEIDGRNKSEKGVYTDVFHIKTEKSKMAQMNEILLDPSKGRMQSSKKYKKDGYEPVLFTTLLQYKL